MSRVGAIRRAAFGAAVCGVFATEDVLAQDAAPPAPPVQAAAVVTTSGDGGASSYPPAFFAEFKPQHAFDMVQRLPGFSFNGGADVRGFGGAAGNVLIDGERPSSKAVSLDAALQRIPVAQVERIDLIRGGAPGIDMQGQPVIANVIRKKGASSSVTVQLLAKPFADGFVGYVPRLEGTWRTGPLSVEGQLGYRNDRTANSGDGPVSRVSSAGALLQSGRFQADERQELANFNGAAEYRPGVDVMRVTFSGAREEVNRRERSDLRDPIGAFISRNDSVEIDEDYEIGGDYERPITDIFTGRIIGLATFSTEEATGVSRGRGAVQEAVQSAEGGERIVRGVLTATTSDTVRIEGGGEATFNFLDQTSRLTEGGVVVPLPSANIRVEERRAEAFLTANWKVSAALSLEAALRYERSTISQTGGAQLEKNLAFAKPRVIVSWAPDDASQVRVRIEREVGQLEFNDFAASAQLDTGQHNAGNPDLEPERGWVVETALERRFWNNGAVVLTLNRAEIESVADLIPIDNRYDAPGNIGDGWRNTAKVSLNLPFDRLGWTGALLKLNTIWIKAEVTDPVTGLTRRISDDRPFASDWLFTQTLPSLNSLFAIETVMDSQRTVYRINEVRRTADATFVKIYWDWTPRPGLTFRFQSENSTGKSQVRKRVLYNGPRSGGLINAYERREARLDPFFMVRMRATF